MNTHEKIGARQARGALLMQGLTLNEWARLRGYQPSNVSHALAGRRRGPKHKRMVEQLMREAGALRSER
jgi:gp16 family phage-associated protein